MIGRSNAGHILSGRSEERALHSLGSMEGYLSTLNKMTNRSEAGQGATACLLGEAPQVKATHPKALLRTQA